MILLPYPHAADDHQQANARSFEARGAAVVINHRATAEQTGEQLSSKLHRLFADETLCDEMRSAAQRCARPDATSLVVDQIQSLVTD